MRKYLKIIIRPIDLFISLIASYVLQNKEIDTIMKRNKIANKKKSDIEDEWVKRWKTLQGFVNRKYFRTYSEFIGDDFNIVPDDICHNIISPILNPIRYRSYYEDKCIFDKVLQSSFNGNVTPKTYYRNINGIMYDEEYKIVPPNRINFNEINADSILVKPSIDTSSGKGISFYYKKNNKFYCNEIELTMEHLCKVYKKNFIVQKVLKQSSFTSQFCSSSVNTLRVEVYKSVKDGKLHIPNIFMRIGQEGSKVDNSHAGAYKVAINPNTGELAKFVRNQYGDTKTIFNGIDFEKSDYVLPNLDEIKIFAKQVASCIVHLHLIALDIMLDENHKPKLIEYNVSAFGPWGYQTLCGTPFKEFTDEIIEYCKCHKAEATRVFITF